MNELRQLLHDNAVTEPADHLDLATVVQVGGRRRRRRRLAVVTAGGVAVAAVVTVGTAVAVRTIGPGPVPTDGRAGQVLTLQDAELAVAGTDYRELAARAQDEGGDETLVGITDDSFGVVLRSDDAASQETSVGLVDPSDGTTEWLPGGPQPIGQTSAIQLGANRLIFRASPWSSMQLAVLVFDRTTETWSSMGWPDLPRAQAYYPTAHDDRLYLTLSTEAGNARMDLWSVSLHDSSDVRDEHGEAALGFDITGDELTWNDGSRGSATRLHIRDLTSGQERTIDPRVSDGCSVHALERVGDRLLLGQVCDDHEDLVQVVTMDGDPVVTIDDQGVGAHIGDGGRVAVISGGEGGPYVLDPATAELWRIGAPSALWVSQQPVPDGSDLTLWSTSDWVPSIDGDPDGPGPNEPTAEDDVTTTQHLVEWLS